jgi:hypothetical protein
MDNGQVVRTRAFTGQFLSVQYPDETTAVLTTEVLSQQDQVHTITVRFIDTYTGTAKGDNLTFVGSNFDYVVTFGQQGNTVVTFVTRPGNIAHAAVFNYIDGQQLGQTINLVGSFAQSDTLSHTTFLFGQYHNSPATAFIVTGTGTNPGNVKTILTTIDLNDPSNHYSAQIDGRVHSLQTDPTRERAYLITEKLGAGNVAIATVLTVLNTTTGSLAPSLTYTGELNTLTLNPDHTRALLIYTDTNGAAHAAIIDTDTGTQTGQTLDLPGGFTDTILLTDDSTRAAILTTHTSKGTTTTLTTINLGHDLIV